MRQEGQSFKIPDPIVISFTAIETRLAKQEAKKVFEKHRGYPERSSIIGWLGEVAIGRYLLQSELKLKHVADGNIYSTSYGDGGIDTRIDGLDIQIKTHSPGGKCLIKRLGSKARYKPLTCDIYIFCELSQHWQSLTQKVKLLGWLPRDELEEYGTMQVSTIGDWWNLAIELKYLRNIQQLTDELWTGLYLESMTKGTPQPSVSSYIGSIRYPGSKAKLANAITRKMYADVPDMTTPLFSDHNRVEYREPFFGSGAIGFAIINQLAPSCPVWINDKDRSLANMWKSISDDIVTLCERIDALSPQQLTPDMFYKFQTEDQNPSLDILRSGFQKIVLQQTSWGGLGFKAGGPLGGRQQQSLYTIDCRWNRARQKRKLCTCHYLLHQHPTRITGRDFSALLCDDKPNLLIYLDPPYFEKGEELYKIDMSDDDHYRLAGMLRRLKHAHWYLSYDDHPKIRTLYSWAEITELEVTYTTPTVKRGETRPKNREILITRR